MQRGIKHPLRFLHMLRLTLRRFYRPVTLGVRVLLITPTDEVLLVRHSYVGGWHLPGGGVDRGESVLTAARREVLEETGLVATGTATVLSLHAQLRPWGSDHVVLIGIESATGNVRPGWPEIAEARFFSLSNLPAGLSSATHRRLQERQNGDPPDEHW